MNHQRRGEARPREDTRRTADYGGLASACLAARRLAGAPGRGGHSEGKTDVPLGPRPRRISERLPAHRAPAAPGWTVTVSGGTWLRCAGVSPGRRPGASPRRCSVHPSAPWAAPAKAPGERAGGQGGERGQVRADDRGTGGRCRKEGTAGSDPAAPEGVSVQVTLERSPKGGARTSHVTRREEGAPDRGWGEGC